jgi:hypothetical protein
MAKKLKFTELEIEELMSSPDGRWSREEAIGWLLEVGRYGRDENLVSRNILWNIIRACKTREDFLNMQSEAMGNESALLRVCYTAFFAKIEADESPSFADLRMHIDYLKARMFAFGLIRGMQQGTLLGRGSKGSATTSPMLQFPSVVRLLLREPVASSADVCDALDRVRAEIPWPKLRNRNPFWKPHSKNPTVKAAISNARKDAQQAAIDERLLAQVKGIRNTGSIFDNDGFKVKERMVGKRRT